MALPVSSALLSKMRRIKDRVKEEQEVCNFCGKIIPADHRHFINLETRKFMCACEICTITQSIHGNFKIIPQRYHYLSDFNMPEALWSEFLIPVNMAFFVFSSKENGIVAYYPAAAGATESKLKMEAWKKVQEINPVVNSLMPDLEALLVNRLGDEGEYYIVPIDSCYKLIGIIRLNWKGINGGREVQDATHIFFDELKQKIS